MKKLLNKKGYTLTYAIIIIAILLVLVSSVIFISFFNFRMSVFGKSVNKKYYDVDAAMEATVTNLVNTIYSFEKEANAEVYHYKTTSDPEAELANYLGNDFINQLNSDLGSGILTTEDAAKIVEHALKGKFEAAFYNKIYKSDAATFEDTQYFNEFETDINLKYPGRTSYLSPYINPSNVPDGYITGASGSNLENDLKAKLSFSSYADSGTKTFDLVYGVNTSVPNKPEISLKVSESGSPYKYVETVIQLSAPEYTFDTGIIRELVKLKENEILNHAILSNGNINLKGALVTGNIYAYGNSIDVNYDQDRSIYKTINVLGENTISGNVETRGVVNVNANSKLNVSGTTAATTGNNLYANALYLNGTSATAVIKDNLYLYSDLFINGANTKLTVGTNTTNVNYYDATTTPVTKFSVDNGFIWALHDGVMTSSGGYEGYTRTGSIILSRASTDGISPANYPKVKANALYLPGVIRYKVFKGSEAYKTGESMTTYNNTEYYQTLGNTNIYQTGVIAELNDYDTDPTPTTGTVYKLIDFIGYAGLNQVDYRKNHYYTIGYYAAQDTTDNILKDISAEDKSIIMLRNLKGEVRTPERGGIYMNGIAPLNGKVYRSDRTEIVTYQDTFESAITHADRHINYLGYYGVDSSSAGLGEQAVFDKWFDIPASVPEIVVINPSSALDTTGAAYQVTSDAEGTLYYNSDKDIVIQAGTFKGVIFTGGNVTVENGAVVEGCIIARGNVILNSGAKVVYNRDIVYTNFYNNLCNTSGTAYDIGYVKSGGRMVNITSKSTDPAFKFTFANNPSEISITSFDGVESEYVNILKSNTVKVLEWKEVN